MTAQCPVYRTLSSAEHRADLFESLPSDHETKLLFLRRRVKISNEITLESFMNVSIEAEIRWGLADT